jgi:hypothetical protein
MVLMRSSTAGVCHTGVFADARLHRRARRSHPLVQARAVDGAMERVVAWAALDVDGTRTLNDGVPESIQCDIDALIADGSVDGGIARAVRGDGVWEVCSAPHIKRLAAPVGVIFSPLRYVIDRGSIDSHVRHRGIVPDGWLSASGAVEEGADMVCDGRMRPSCVIRFDKFWVGASVQTKDEPRSFPAEDEASVVDKLIDTFGNAGFVDGFAKFPVLFYNEEQGLVIFQFPPLRSNICAVRRT